MYVYENREGGGQVFHNHFQPLNKRPWTRLNFQRLLIQHNTGPQIVGGGEYFQERTTHSGSRTNRRGQLTVVVEPRRTGLAAGFVGLVGKYQHQFHTFKRTSNCHSIDV